MNLADAAPQPELLWGTAACAGLVCLLVVSGIVLAVVLLRRNKRKQSG